MRAEIEYNFKDRPNAWTIERLSSNREGNDRCTGLPIYLRPHTMVVVKAWHLYPVG
jgi:hypothetical protein